MEQLLFDPEIERTIRKVRKRTRQLKFILMNESSVIMADNGEANNGGVNNGGVNNEVAIGFERLCYVFG